MFVVLSQKTVIFIATIVRISNVTCYHESYLIFENHTYKNWDQFFRQIQQCFLVSYKSTSALGS